MLFDLHGKRRRLVQATYLTLALLMGGGLVLFGIGGEVQGGLFDALGDRSGGGGGSVIEDRLEKAEERLRQDPRNESALKEVARASFQLAADDLDRNTGVYGEDGKAALEGASRAWERYLDLPPKEPDASLAGLMIQAYSQVGLNQPEKAVPAAEILAEADESAAAYVRLVLYASLAGQKRKADLAGRKAVELAPKRGRKAIQAQVEQAKAAAAQAQAGAAGAPGGAPPPGGAGPGTGLPGGAPPGGTPPPPGSP